MADDANVLRFLRASAERVPGRVALVAGGRSVRFGELWWTALRVAGGLRERGVGVGERAVVMVPMSLELYFALLGILAAGAVAVFVDPWVRARRMGALAAVAEPRAFVGSWRAIVLRLLDPRLRRIPLAIGPRRLRRLAGAAPVDVAPRAADDSALVTFTTGSSGVPKGADRTHGFLAAQHAALAAELPWRDDDVDMPLFPVFALNDLALGIPAIVPDVDLRRVASADGAAIARQMTLHGVTTLTASPPFVDRLAAAVAGGAAPRPRLRRILAGGAPVEDAQLRAWRTAFPDAEVVVVYGSTEAEPVTHLTLEERLAAVTEPGSPGGVCVGRPSPRLATRLVRIEPGPLAWGDGGWTALAPPPAEPGELVVTGEHVCRRYFRSPQAERETKLVDGDGVVWHRMGDTGRFDDAGRFWLAGRVHSSIRRGDGWVHPLLVERAAAGDDPRVRGAAAVGVGDGQDGRVVVVVESDADDADAVRRDVAARLRAAGHDVDEVVVTARPLPVDPRHNAKVDHAAVRAWLERR